MGGGESKKISGDKCNISDAVHGVSWREKEVGREMHKATVNQRSEDTKQKDNVCDKGEQCCNGTSICVSVQEEVCCKQVQLLNCHSSADYVGQCSVEESGSVNSAHKSTVLPQILSALAASMGNFSCGTFNGWSGAALTQIEEDFIMGPTEMSIVVSAVSAGALVGSLISGKIADILGRRSVMLFTAPIMAASWIAIGMAPNLYFIYLGRFFGGLGTGILFHVSQVYISEICQANIRGRMSSLTSMALTIGVLTTYTLGTVVQWRTACYVLIAPHVLHLLGMGLSPESPYWYLLKGRKEEASGSLRVLRGKDYYFEEEMTEMELKIASTGQASGYKELLHLRSRIPLAIALFTQTSQQMCASNIVMMYTSKIFQEAGSSIDVQYATMYTGISQLVGTTISIALIDYLGRRILLASSVGLVGICAITLGSYLYAINNSVLWPGWLPLFAIVSNVFFYCLGCRSIPWLVAAELFSTPVRSRATSICVVYNRLLNLLIVQTYSYFKVTVGNEYVFFFYGGMGIICSIITIFYVPETKGKTLEEIQDYFENESFKRKNQSNKS